jgi:hypothetical protein
VSTVAAFALAWACVPPIDDVEPADLRRFPPRAITGLFWRQALEHERWLVDRAALYPDLGLEPWINDARRCRVLWGLLDDAHLAADPGRCCELLRALRAELGDACYFGGQMPPHLPIWRFGRADP